MNKKEIFAAIAGGAFFAVPYVALAVPLVPSLIIGAGAFVAGELVLTEKEKTLKETNEPLYKKIENAKRQNKHILEMIKNIEDTNIKEEIEEINKTVNNIINTIVSEPKKAREVKNFFEYYLPLTEKIIDRYDLIENQRISSKEDAKFKESANKMIKEVNKAFKKILSQLYESEMIDTDVEMKVFNSMLKADGILDNELSIKED